MFDRYSSFGWYLVKVGNLRVEDRFLLELENTTTFGWFLQLREIKN